MAACGARGFAGGGNAQDLGASAMAVMTKAATATAQHHHHHRLISRPGGGHDRPGRPIAVFIARVDPLPEPQPVERVPSSTLQAAEFFSSEACRKADEKAAALAAHDPTIMRARRLLADDISLERAWRELNEPRDQAAASTIKALMLALRERGVAALAETGCRRRLADLSSAQISQGHWPPDGSAAAPSRHHR